MVETAADMQRLLKNNMDAKKLGFEAYLQKMQRHFEQNSKIRDVQAHSSKVHSVAWSCDGRRLASGSFDRSVSIYTLDKYGLSKEANHRGHTESVDQLCWHPSNPDMLVTASGDKTIRIWDTRAGKCVNVVNTKGENINICWSPDGNTIAVGNKDCVILTLGMLLDFLSKKLKNTRPSARVRITQSRTENHSEDLITFVDAKTYKAKCEEQFRFEVNEISWNNDNNLFFLTNGQGFINILSYPELKPLQTLHAHPANCICIKFGPTGKYFATGSADALMSLWDLDELVCVRTFSRLDWPVRTLSFSHDGQMIASGSEDLLIDIAMVETGEKICDVPCTAPTFTLAWHPRKHILAFACDDKDKHDRDAGTVRIFGLPSQ